jgi:hypothetical protein
MGERPAGAAANIGRGFESLKSFYRNNVLGSCEGDSWPYHGLYWRTHRRMWSCQRLKGVKLFAIHAVRSLTSRLLLRFWRLVSRSLTFLRLTLVVVKLVSSEVQVSKDCLDSGTHQQCRQGPWWFLYILWNVFFLLIFIQVRCG